jgi:hypothetical protein
MRTRGLSAILIPRDHRYDHTEQRDGQTVPAQLIPDAVDRAPEARVALRTIV